MAEFTEHINHIIQTITTKYNRNFWNKYANTERLQINSFSTQFHLARTAELNIELAELLQHLNTFLDRGTEYSL